MSDLYRCLTNDKLEFQYDVLESIINKPELLDVPIVVYSIAGPERTGKSFLLNLFWYLLKNRNIPVDEDADIPQVFPSVRSFKPETKGIYMTTQPVDLFGYAKSTKVALFLMDTQGIQSGDRVECKEGDIFTISLALSYMQIVNVKDRLKFPDVDTYASLTLFAKSVFCNLPEKTKNLTVLVRDWFYTDAYDCGYGGGKKYMTDESKELSMKLGMQCLNLFYDKVDCFLAPCPGNVVEKSNPKCINDIDKEAKEMFLELAFKLFSTSNIQRAAQVAPKGKDFLSLAKNMNEAFSSESKPLAPDRSYKNFLDYITMNKISQCCDSYKSHMMQFIDTTGNSFEAEHDSQKRKETEKLVMNKSVEDMSSYVAKLHQLIGLEYKKLFDVVMQKQFTIYLRKYISLMKEFRDLTGDELKAKHEEKSDEVTLTLKENNPIEDNSAYIQQFHASILHAEYEIYFGHHLATEYAEEWGESVNKVGNFSLKEVRTLFEENGREYIQRFEEKITNNSSRSVVVANFMEQINNKFQNEIKRRKRNKRIAIGIGGTFAGLVAGGLFLLIPPLGALAVGSELATELVMAMMASGVATGSLTGTASVLVAGKVYQNREEIPPNITDGIKQNSESKGAHKEQVDSLNSEAEGQQSQERKLGTSVDNSVSVSGQLTLMEDEESNDTGLGDENELLIQEEVEFVEATQRGVNRIIELFKRGK